jgi:hypothetical protein
MHDQKHRDWKSQNNETIDTVRDTYGRQVHKKFSYENVKEKATGIRGCRRKDNIKILKQLDDSLWIEFIWLRIRTSGRLL